MINNHYICISSLLFLVPSFLALYINHNLLAYSGIVTTLASINYWRNVEYGTRRKLDLICSRIMITIGSSHYFYYSDNIYDIVLFCFLGKILSFLYNNGHFGKEIWYIYHMTFHFMLMVSATLTIYKINCKAKIF